MIGIFPLMVFAREPAMEWKMLSVSVCRLVCFCRTNTWYFASTVASLPSVTDASVGFDVPEWQERAGSIYTGGRRQNWLTWPQAAKSIFVCLCSKVVGTREKKEGWCQLLMIIRVPTWSKTDSERSSSCKKSKNKADGKMESVYVNRQFSVFPC